MTARDFAYWLQGFFEVAEPRALTEAQTDLVRRHLNLVFIHDIDPSIDKGDPATKAKLDAVHHGAVPALIPMPGSSLPPHMDPSATFPPGMRPRC